MISRSEVPYVFGENGRVVLDAALVPCWLTPSQARALARQLCIAADVADHFAKGTKQ